MNLFGLEVTPKMLIMLAAIVGGVVAIVHPFVYPTPVKMVDVQTLDVFPALAILVARGDEDTGEWLSIILNRLPYRIYGTEAPPSEQEQKRAATDGVPTPTVTQFHVSHLHSNGFDIVRSYVHSTGALPAADKDRPTPEMWFDATGRPRIVCMYWLLKLEYHQAVPEVAKLLRSEHADERNVALAVAEELSKMPDQHISKIKVPGGN